MPAHKGGDTSPHFVDIDGTAIEVAIARQHRSSIGALSAERSERGERTLLAGRSTMG